MIARCSKNKKILYKCIKCDLKLKKTIEEQQTCTNANSTYFARISLLSVSHEDGNWAYQQKRFCFKKHNGVFKIIIAYESNFLRTMINLMMINIINQLNS